MPRPPGIIDRVNYVTTFIEDPCVAPWTVYVETALPALGTMFMEYVTPSPQDVLRFYIKPVSMRAQRKFLKSGEIEEESFTNFELLPDVNELVGTILPFSNRLASSAVHDKISAFWVIDGIVERGLWYWMLADMSLDFLFDWTTAINRSQGCGQSAGGSALLYRNLQLYAVPTLYLAVEPMEVRKSWGSVSGDSNGIITFEHAGGAIVGGMTITASAGVTNVRARIFDYDYHHAVQTRYMNFTDKPGLAQTAMFKVENFLAHRYGFEVSFDREPNTAGLIIVTEVHLNGFATWSPQPD